MSSTNAAPGNATALTSTTCINGKKAKRSKLKPGMTCEIVYGSNGGEVKSVSCSAGQT